MKDEFLYSGRLDNHLWDNLATVFVQLETLIESKSEDFWLIWIGCMRVKKLVGSFFFAKNMYGRVYIEFTCYKFTVACIIGTPWD